MNLFLLPESRAQNSVGIGTTEPNPNAVLELHSDHQGFLVPSLTSAQRNQMAGILGGSSENNGLIVFDRDNGKFYYWLDGEWISGLGDFSGSASGDLSGNFPQPKVIALQGNPVSSLTPGKDQILHWNGKVWEPADNYSAGKGIGISNNMIINTGDTDPGDDLLKTDVAGGDISGTFDNLQLVPGSVSSNEISNASITTSKIPDGAVTLNKIKTGPAGAILTTDNLGVPTWESKDSFANDKTHQQGILLGNGTDILGMQGTAANQLLKWNAVVSEWELADDNDRQQLSLKANTLSLSGDVTPVDLGIYLDDTDEQDLGNVLTQGNNAGGHAIENMADPVNPQDAATKNYVDGINTDDADADPVNELQDLSLSGDTLSLSGSALTIDLGGYLDNTDDQQLSLTGNALQLENGGAAVDLSGYLDNTDAQDLSNVLAEGNDAGAAVIRNMADPVNPQDAATKNYVDGINTDDADADPGNELQDLFLSGDTLSLSGSSLTIDLGGYLDNTDAQNLSNVLAKGNDAGAVVIRNIGDPVNPQDAATKNYVDGINTDDADADPGNELQDLSLSGDTLSLSGSSLTIDLGGYLDNTDAQDLGNVLTRGNNAGGQAIENMADPVNPQDAATKNYVDGINTDDADADPGNELQDLSLSGDTLSLSGSAVAIDLDGYLDNTDEQDLSNVLGRGNDAGGMAIVNLANPAASQDAATKNYVDSLDTADLDKDPGNELITGAVLNQNDLEITEGGVTTVISGVGRITQIVTLNGSGITGGTISGAAYLKLANTGKGQILIGDSANVNAVKVTGDVTLDETGKATLTDGAVTTGKLADASVTANKLMNGSVTDAKITSVSYSKLTGSANTNDILQWDGSQWKAVALATGATVTVTKYQSVGPVSFERAGDGLKADISYPNDGDYAFMNSGGTGTALAPLLLPDKAVIGEVTMYLYDNISDDIYVSLVKKPLDGSPVTEIPLVNTLGASGSTQQISSLPLSEIVDNSTFIYRIKVVAKPDVDHRIYGARLTLTETTVDATVPNGSRMGGALNISPSAPSPPQEGMLWMDSDDEVIYYYDGSSWRQLMDDDGGIL